MQVFTNNPGFLSDDELVSTSVVRAAELDLLLESVRENSSDSNQHVLVIGPRGMGKTTLVHLLAAHVRRDDTLRAAWFPIVLGEEIPAVLSVGELWLEVIRQLAEVDDRERWMAVYKDLLLEKNDQRLRERALGQLISFSDQTNRRLLLVVENLNGLLGEQLTEDDAWTLRHTLLNQPRLMVVGTATTRFDEIEHVEKAMFDLFKLQVLEPLDAEECRRLHESITGVYLEGLRVRPLQIWSGGNPRLVVVIASFIRDSSFSGLLENLQRLVDHHTAYFKSNLEALPISERKVYVTLAELWNAATAREVAERARMEVNKTSAYLARLEKRGAVLSEMIDRGTKKYRVSERLFTIFHLLRSQRGQARRLQGLIEFMSGFYEPRSPSELKPCVDELDEKLLQWAGPWGLVEIAARLVALEPASRVLTMFEAVKSPVMEPLLVALALMADEAVDVPSEMLAVAQDVRDYITAQSVATSNTTSSPR